MVPCLLAKKQILIFNLQFFTEDIKKSSGTACAWWIKNQQRGEVQRFESMVGTLD
jgi:hypothetical protein